MLKTYHNIYVHIYIHIQAGVSCGKWKSMGFPGKMIENKTGVFFTLILVYQRIILQSIRQRNNDTLRYPLVN